MSILRKSIWFSALCAVTAFPTFAQTLFTASPAQVRHDVTSYLPAFQENLSITNHSSSTLVLQVSSPADTYPVVDTAISINAGATETVSVTYEMDNLPHLGVHHSHITVTDTASGASQNIPVVISAFPDECDTSTDWHVYDDRIELWYFNRTDHINMYNCTNSSVDVDLIGPANIPWIQIPATADMGPIDSQQVPVYLPPNNPEGFYADEVEVLVNDGTQHSIKIPLFMYEYVNPTQLVMSPENQTVYVEEGEPTVPVNLTYSKDGNARLDIWAVGDILDPVRIRPSAPWTSYDIQVDMDTSGLTFGVHDVRIAGVVATDPGGSTFISHDEVNVRVVVTRPNTYNACLSQSAVIMNMVQGVHPGVYHVVLTNCGDAPIDFTVHADHIPWMNSVTPTSGHLNHLAEATLSLRPSSNLTPGTYSDTVTINYTGGQLTLPVTAHVTPATTPAQLSISTNSVSVATPEGVNPAHSHVNIANTGGENLGFTVAENISWLMVSPSTGTLNGGNNVDLRFRYDTAALNPGTYNGTVTVNSDGGTEHVAVSVTVVDGGSIPVLSVSPTSIAATGIDGQPIPYQQLTITNTAGMGDFTISHNTSWLSMVTGTQTIGANTTEILEIGFDGAELAPGTYNGIISLTTLTDMVTVPVTLTITGAGPVPHLSVPSIEVTVTQGSSTPSEAVYLSNVGSGWSMPFTAFTRPVRNNGAPAYFGQVNWLSVNPTSGTVFGAPKELKVAMNTKNLGLGTHTGFVIVQAGNDKALLPVTVKVISGGAEY